jgi:hypothetical protein
MSDVAGADTDLDLLFEEVKALRELAEDQDKARDDNRVYAFSIRWGALVFGRLERLAYYDDGNALPAQAQQRYDSLVTELRELLPVMDKLGIARPKVPLNG